MLTTLRKLEKRKKQGVLASCISDLLPSPTEDSVAVDPETAELKARVFEELLSRRGLHDENGNIDKAKLLQVLSEEMGAAILEPSQISKVRDRVAEKGLLEANEYQIVFEQDFLRNMGQMFVTKETVRSAIRNPDALTHLLPTDFPIAEGSAATTIVLKQFGGPNGHTLLVLCRRVKAVFHVHCAWRVFGSDVGNVDMNAPLDVLRQFVDKFGLRIRSGEFSGKFLWYQTVRTTTLFGGTNLFSVDEYLEAGRKIFATFVVHSIDPITYAVAVGFAIDTDAYRDAMLEHGVR